MAVHASIRDFEKLASKEKDKIYAMHYNEFLLDVSEVEGIKLVKPNQVIMIGED